MRPEIEPVYFALRRRAIECRQRSRQSTGSTYAEMRGAAYDVIADEFDEMADEIQKSGEQ